MPLPSASRDWRKMAKSENERTSERSSKARVVQLGGREIVTEGLHLNFWADISHRCMTASWPAFIGGAALVFIAFNAVFAMLYWIGNQPISNVPGGAYIDYLYFSIETLSTAGYGDMHPDTHYGHFIATVELFTGIFSMSLMTGLIFARFSRPNARLLFAENPVISNHEGVPTLMIRLANERHNIISNATARLWAFKTEVSLEGVSFRRLWWCRDMTSLPRKRSTHESPTITRIFVSGNATWISSAPRKMADSKLITAGSMTPWRDDYRIRAMSTISARRIPSVPHWIR